VRSFATIKSWREFDWEERFRSAEVEIEIGILRPDT